MDIKLNSVEVVYKNRDSFVSVEARIAIIATGFGSNLIKKLHLPQIKDFLIGAQAEVSSNDIERVEIYLNHEIAPGSFGWLVPTQGNKALAGLMTYSKPKWYLDQTIAKLKAQNKIASPNVTKRYGVIPLQTLRKMFADRVLIVGEAAGQVKPMTGGGAYTSAFSVQISQASIIQRSLNRNNYSAGTLSLYQLECNRLLGREFTIGRWGQNIWKKLSNNSYRVPVQHRLKNNLPENFCSAKICVSIRTVSYYSGQHT